MRILILGATGRTGKYLLSQALQRNHIVHVLIRDKNKINIDNERLLVFEGSPANESELNSAMKDCKAVLSAMNISRINDWPWARLRSPKDLLSLTMKNIIDLAPLNHIQRIIFTSA